MKLLYLIYFDPEDVKMSGVKKKIHAQITSLKDQGHEVDFAYRKDNRFIISNNDFRKEMIIKKGVTRYRYSIFKEFKKSNLKREYDKVYIRFPNTIDYSFLSLLREIGIKKSIVEIPTFPIAGEYKAELKKLYEKKKYLELVLKIGLFHQSKFLSIFIKFYLKNLVTFSNFEKIWGIKCINVDNGVDTEKLAKINHFSRSLQEDGTLILSGIANVSIWHGFDRVIRGISETASNLPVKFQIVGAGDEIDNLKSLVKQLKIENKVIFLGPLYGEDLLKVYSSTDLAVSSLGMYRIGLSTGSTIKTKEYCSLGIPFIYGYTEKAIPSDWKYAVKVPNNNEYIDIAPLFSFIKSISHDEVSNEMHRYAELNFDWKIQMAKVIRESVTD